METIQIGELTLTVAPEVNLPSDNKGALKTKPVNTLTVADVAQKYGWTVEDEKVRVIYRMKFPARAIEINGWKVMRTFEYKGIVPQEALGRVRTLLDEGLAIKGLLIADDMRKSQPQPIEKLTFRAKEKFKAIDWDKRKSEVAQKIKVATEEVTVVATAGKGKLNKKAKEVNWEKVGSAALTGAKVLGIGVGLTALAAAALPLLFLAAVPAMLLTFDPWLIVVDEDERWWLIYEWWTDKKEKGQELNGLSKPGDKFTDGSAYCGPDWACD